RLRPWREPKRKKSKTQRKVPHITASLRALQQINMARDKPLCCRPMSCETGGWLFRDAGVGQGVSGLSRVVVQQPVEERPAIFLCNFVAPERPVRDADSMDQCDQLYIFKILG